MLRLTVNHTCFRLKRRSETQIRSFSKELRKMALINRMIVRLNEEKQLFPFLLRTTQEQMDRNHLQIKLD